MDRLRAGATGPMLTDGTVMASVRTDGVKSLLTRSGKRAIYKDKPRYTQTLLAEGLETREKNESKQFCPSFFFFWGGGGGGEEGWGKVGEGRIGIIDNDKKY